MKSFDNIIVGGGMAGLTATAYLAKAGREVALFEKIYYFGGLVNTFERKGYKFDGGLRSIENSGIVFPMLNQLGIDVPFVKSHVSLITGNSILRLSGQENIDEYQNFLLAEFPGEQEAIQKIIKKIKQITRYMDVLYGIDNPLFMDIPGNKTYLFKELLPWLFKFLLTIRRIEKLDEPVYAFLQRYTDNMQLIDNIAQHFFKDTPTSFALSYFSLYNDYNYPLGGTGKLAEAVHKYCEANGASMNLNTAIVKVDPESKTIVTKNGDVFGYNKLIWACDLKALYKTIDIEKINDPSLKKTVRSRSDEIQDLHGAESVFTGFYAIKKDPSFFGKIATEHCFYTPSKKGLSSITLPGDDKASIKRYLRELVEHNTLEISIPALRDQSLSPEGETGIEISLLFDYQLSKKIKEQGWKKEFKQYMESLLLDQLDKLYPGIKTDLLWQFSASPLTIEKYTSNSEGAIVGWSFANSSIPVVHSFRDVAKSVKTPFPDIFKAGQWSYSPAGVPIAILTGKLAADKITK
jgi:phytoene dehydrogenase-like protein